MILPILLTAVTTTCAVIDGDTLRCDQIGRVRLLGIDAPELPGHCRKGRVCAPGDGEASKQSLRRASGSIRRPDLLLKIIGINTMLLCSFFASFALYKALLRGFELIDFRWLACAYVGLVCTFVCLIPIIVW